MENIVFVVGMFVAMTIVNVILNTARVIITVKGGMFLSALISAIAFGCYSWVVVLTVETKMYISTFWIAFITALVNFIGVYIVKYFENRMRRDRLWVVDVVIFAKRLRSLREYLNGKDIQFTELPIENSDDKLFHIYSNNHDESRMIRDLLSSFGAKYFVSESKSL